MTQTELPAESAAATTASPSTLEDRYGRSRQRGIDRRFGWIAGIALVIAGIGFLVFSGWQQGTNIEFSDLKYEVISPTETQLGFEVTAPPNEPVACALEALSTSFSTVGWKIVELPVSEERHRVFNETLLTTYPATTATVRSCWIVENPAAE